MRCVQIAFCLDGSEMFHSVVNIAAAPAPKASKASKAGKASSGAP
jgi:hypothetical protein